MHEQYIHCSKCGQEQASDQFRKGHRQCRTCERSARQEWGRANPDRIKEHRRTYHQRHRDERNESSRKHYAANRERRGEQRRKYEEAHKEQLAEASRRWVERNRDHLRRYQAERRVKKKAHLAEYRKAWVAKNPEYKKVYNNLRRAASGSHTAKQWQELKALYGCRCLSCGRPESERPLTIDHVVPLSCGGSNDISNIQPLCKPCNASKKAKTIDFRPQFLEQLSTALAHEPDSARRPRRDPLPTPSPAVDPGRGSPAARRTPV